MSAPSNLNVSRNARKDATVMKRWEYLTTPLMIHTTTQILNNWGAEGWELVQVVSGPEGGLVAYLKREIASES